MKGLHLEQFDDPVFQFNTHWLATLGHMTDSRIFIGLDSSYHLEAAIFVIVYIQKESETVSSFAVINSSFAVINSFIQVSELELKVSL